MDVQTFSLAELQTRWDQQPPSPADSGRVVVIVRRPGPDQREVLEQADFSLAEGLVGDSWSRRGVPNPQAQVTLMSTRVIQTLCPDPARWPLAGDQLLVDLDLSEDNLPAGARLSVGGALLEISPLPHTGCAKFTERFGSDATRFVNSPQGRRERRRGVNARVIHPGPVRTGDSIRKAE